MDGAYEGYPVNLEIDYPDRDLDAVTTLSRPFAILPIVIVLLAVLSVAAFACVIVAWFAILFTGRYPRGLFDFVVGVLRWWVRVSAYAVLLVTDRYPPFRLAT